MIPKEFFVALRDILSPKTFGQLGEDAVIENHIGWLGLPVNAKGTYLDIGAYHPTRGSNSYRFYRRGASGYAVDIGKRKERIWSIIRPRDTFINAAVVPNASDQKHTNFFMGNGYGEVSDHVSGSGVKRSKSRNGKWVQVKTLTANALSALILNNCSWHKAPWRFLTIDIEGLDEQFISDLDLIDLAPDVIAVEHFPPSDVSDWNKIEYLVNSCEINKKLRDQGFILQSICGPTLIFVRASSRKFFLDPVKG